MPRFAPGLPGASSPHTPLDTRAPVSRSPTIDFSPRIIGRGGVFPAGISCVKPARDLPVLDMFRRPHAGWSSEILHRFTNRPSITAKVVARCEPSIGLPEHVTLSCATDHDRCSKNRFEVRLPSSHRRMFRRLTGGASAASEGAKGTNESAARACWAACARSITSSLSHHGVGCFSCWPEGNLKPRQQHLL